MEGTRPIILHKPLEQKNTAGELAVGGFRVFERSAARMLPRASQLANVATADIVKEGDVVYVVRQDDQLVAAEISTDWELTDKTENDTIYEIVSITNQAVVTGERRYQLTCRKKIFTG